MPLVSAGLASAVVAAFLIAGLAAAVLAPLAIGGRPAAAVLAPLVRLGGGIRQAGRLARKVARRAAVTLRQLGAIGLDEVQRLERPDVFAVKALARQLLEIFAPARAHEAWRSRGAA